MNLPRELRNRIYEFVFCDDSTYTHETIAYRWVDDIVSQFGITWDSKPEAETAYVPQAIGLDCATPPSKDCILLCRQLHCEMKQMYVAAYRSYWTANRFLYDPLEVSWPDASNLPADKDMKRIREFLIYLDPDYRLRIVFNGLGWESWLLPDDSVVHRFYNFGTHAWLTQEAIKGAVDDFVASKFTLRPEGNPYMGQGLTRDMIATISQLEHIEDEIRNLPVEDDEQEEEDEDEDEAEAEA